MRPAGRTRPRDPSPSEAFQPGLKIGAAAPNEAPSRWTADGRAPAKGWTDSRRRGLSADSPARGRRATSPTRSSPLPGLAGCAGEFQPGSKSLDARGDPDGTGPLGGMRPTRPVPGAPAGRFQPGLKTACLPTRHPAPTLVRRVIRGSAHPIPAGVSAGQAGQQDDRRSRPARLWLGEDPPRSPFSESHRIVRRFQPGLKAHRRPRSRGQA